MLKEQGAPPPLKTRRQFYARYVKRESFAEVIALPLADVPFAFAHSCDNEKEASLGESISHAQDRLILARIL